MSEIAPEEGLSDSGSNAWAADEAALTARAIAFMREVPDYQDAIDALVAAGKDPILPPHVFSFLNACPVVFVLGYRLAKRHDLLEWIVTLPPDNGIEVLEYLASATRFDLYMPDLQQQLSGGCSLFCEPMPAAEFWTSLTVESIQAQLARAKLHAWSAPPTSRLH